MEKIGYDCHLFICTNKKANGLCCAQKPMEDLRVKLKQKLALKFGKRVRVNASGCLGHCEKGGVAVLYPEAKWYFDLDENDLDRLEADICERLKDEV